MRRITPLTLAAALASAAVACSAAAPTDFFGAPAADDQDASVTKPASTTGDGAGGDGSGTGDEGSTAKPGNDGGAKPPGKDGGGGPPPPDAGAHDAGPDAPVTTPDAGAAACHALSNACASAQGIIPISGDTGADHHAVVGNTSRWYKVKISETDTLLRSLSYDAVLTSPANAKYELYTYEGTGAAPSCAPDDAEEADGDPPEATDSWDDNFAADDGRYITFEIRYVSGASCDNWTLDVYGNVDE